MICSGNIYIFIINIHKIFSKKKTPGTRPCFCLFIVLLHDTKYQRINLTSLLTLMLFAYVEEITSGRETLVNQTSSFFYFTFQRSIFWPHLCSLGKKRPQIVPLTYIVYTTGASNHGGHGENLFVPESVEGLFKTK